MDLTKLFKAQNILDNRIYDRFPELKNQNNLDWKILALQVELGELANEWRGFKKWSEDQEPRIDEVVYSVASVPLRRRNPLLEEYVDCLHFILSIGIELGVDFEKLDLLETCSHLPITTIFSELMVMLPDCLLGHGKYDRDSAFEMYDICLSNFVELGKMLDFTWEQIEQAYFDKNKVNHKRQENGY